MVGAERTANGIPGFCDEHKDDRTRQCDGCRPADRLKVHVATSVFLFDYSERSGRNVMTL